MDIITNMIQNLPYIGLLLMGIALRLIIGMRKFNRRGVGGLQHFSNYFIGLITLFVEWVLNCMAYALIVWGLLGLAFM